jgi:hypothetical protein
MKKFVTFVLVFIATALPFIYFIEQGIRYSIQGWASDPVAMISKIIFSFIFGQAIFWIIGYDQFGLFMDPKKQLGFGQKVAKRLQSNIPLKPSTSWLIKVLEIVTDAGKIPIEGLLYIRYGFVPDALAATITQPLFSTIETAEKISGAIISPKKVNTSEQIRLSIGCIYGSLFRYLMAGLLWIFGTALYALVGIPIESIISRVVSFF